MSAPTQVGPYRLLAPLGHGGMGSVWQAAHARSGVQVAVKLVQPEGVLEEAARDALAHEVRAVAALDHRHIVRVLDHGVLEEEGTPWLAMELGQTTLGAARGQLDWEGVEGALHQLLEALGHAHAHGLIHRDLKPANVLRFGAREGWKLADFGIAHALQTAGRPEGTGAGTAWYMAPEQVLGEWRRFGPWTDLYALGCMAWELLTGLPPFPGRVEHAVVAHLTQSPPALAPIVAVPVGLEGWLRRLLAKNPRDRFVFAADARAALASLGSPVLQAGGPPPSAEGAAPTFDERAMRRAAPTWVGSGLATELAAVVEERAAVSRPAPGARPGVWFEAVESSPTLWLQGAGLGLLALRTPRFVGRVAERTALVEAVQAVRESGQARVVRVVGRRGAGVSRLAEWLAVRAHELGQAHVVRARHDTDAGGLGSMVATYAGCLGLEGPERRARLAEWLASGGLEDPVEVDAVSALVAPDGSAHAAADARYATVARLIRRADRPVLVVLDDVQWGLDALGLAHALARERDLPVLLVVCARAEALDGAAQRDFDRLEGEVLRLGPLDERVSAQLVDDLVALHPSLKSEIAQRAGGNPLFTIQLARELVTRAVLVPDVGGHRLREGADLTFPANLAGAGREAALALVEEGERPAFEAAALLGSWVGEGSWSTVCDRAGLDRPGATLRRLLDGGQIVGSRERWRFAETLVREGLVDSARASGRHRELGAICAQVLAEAGAPPEQVGAVWVQAGQPEHAVGPLREATRVAMDRGDYRTVLRLTERTLRVSPPEPARVEALILSSVAISGLGDMEAGAARAREAEQAARALGDSWLLGRALLADGFHARIRGEVDRAKAHSDEASALFREVGDERWLLRAELDRASTEDIYGDPADQLPTYRAVAEKSAKFPENRVYADGLVRLGHALERCGRSEEALGVLERALVVAKGRLLHTDQSDVWLGMARCHRRLGDPVAARAAYGRTLELAERGGSTARVGMAWMGVGLLEVDERDFGKAVGSFREALRRSPPAPHALHALSLINLGMALCGRGASLEAVPVLDRAIACFEATHRQGYLYAAQVARVAALWDQPAFDRALAEVLAQPCHHANALLVGVLGDAAERAEAAGQRGRSQSLVGLRQTLEAELARRP